MVRQEPRSLGFDCSLVLSIAIGRSGRLGRRYRERSKAKLARFQSKTASPLPTPIRTLALRRWRFVLHDFLLIIQRKAVLQQHGDLGEGEEKAQRHEDPELRPQPAFEA